MPAQTKTECKNIMKLFYYFIEHKAFNLMKKGFSYWHCLHIGCPHPLHLLTEVDITAAKHSMQA